MLLSVNWLQEFTPYQGTVQELAHRLTMLGLEVEEQILPYAHLQGMLVGQITECWTHPKADQLQLCKVNLGQGQKANIVCGAPNVAAGQLVPVAPSGSTLPDGSQIKATKIRGEESQGMILSEKELGLGEDHSGIMVLEPELHPGQSLLQAMNLEDVLLDIGLTPNRGDCLSVLGIAREVSAAFGLPLHLPETSVQESSSSCPDMLRVHIQEPDLCPLYQARILTQPKLGPSPFWLRKRLLSLGLRPVNNIVDVTNYVLLELGQPLHAFDRELLAGDLIQVARSGEKQNFTTLDGQEQCLLPEDLLIWDQEKPIALAGIMGGANTEISPNTRDVILECAIFDPIQVRKTCRRLGLSSESAFRFERGVDQVGSRNALQRACHLLQKISGAKLLQGECRQEPRPWQSVQIEFRPSRASQLLALDLQKEFCQNTLQDLGCSIVKDQNRPWLVQPPSYRQDLTREVDLIEEIGRFYGFEQIASSSPSIKRPLFQEKSDQGQGQADYEFLHQIKTWAQGQGLQEVINYSFVAQKDLDRLGLDSQSSLRIQNPLSSDQDSLRSLLAPGLLHSLALNAAQGNAQQQLFELARCFEPDPGSETKAREKNLLGLALHGLRQPERWPWPRQEADFAELKGLLEHLFARLLLPEFTCSLQQGHPFLEPAVEIWQQEALLGIMGRLKPALARENRLRYAVWLAELDVDQLFRLQAAQELVYQPWPKFPPVVRDMTIVAGSDVSYEQLQNKIQEAGSPILHEFQLQDLYQPQGSAKRNLTLRLIYRHQERTLTDKEVDQEHARLGDLLLQDLPVSFP
ncbi:MAG: phenylalanine--tRNA ligase subunit beta [Desulfohalobiaceae bacterium]